MLAKIKCYTVNPSYDPTWSGKSVKFSRFSELHSCFFQIFQILSGVMTIDAHFYRLCSFIFASVFLSVWTSVYLRSDNWKEWLLPVAESCVCVFNQWAYADNFADASIVFYGREFWPFFWKSKIETNSCSASIEHVLQPMSPRRALEVQHLKCPYACPNHMDGGIHSDHS